MEIEVKVNCQDGWKNMDFLSNCMENIAYFNFFWAFPFDLLLISVTFAPNNDCDLDAKKTERRFLMKWMKLGGDKIIIHPRLTPFL